MVDKQGMNSNNNADHEEEEDAPDFQFKVILVGNKKVGKTSISNRYVHNIFKENYQTSTKVEFKRKNVPIPETQLMAQLHIWDTLGQEKFKTLAPVFFRRSAAAFLVYDVTDKQTFLALDSWHKQIEESTDKNILIMLLGNKVDLPNKEVTYDMGAEYAKSKGWGFLEVSAKQDTNIRNAFTNLVSGLN